MGKEEDRPDRRDKGEARTAVQDLRTWALMPSGPIAEAGSRPHRSFATFSGELVTNSSRQWVCRVRWSQNGEGWEYEIWEANTEFKHFTLF